QTDCGSEIVVVVVIDLLAWIWRFLANQLNRCGGTGNPSRLEQIIKTGTGNTEYTRSIATVVRWRPEQAVILPWHSVIIPAHTQVECERTGDFPVVLKKAAHFALVVVSNLPRRKTIRGVLRLGHLAPRLKCKIG